DRLGLSAVVRLASKSTATNRLDALTREAIALASTRLKRRRRRPDVLESASDSRSSSDGNRFAIGPSGLRSANLGSSEENTGSASIATIFCACRSFGLSDRSAASTPAEGRPTISWSSSSSLEDALVPAEEGTGKAAKGRYCSAP